MYDKQAMYREIEAYMQHINFAYNCYEAYISLFDINERYNDVLNLSPGFFTITRFSLSKCLLLETAKLFCGSKDERTIQKLIRIVQSNNSAFDTKLVLAEGGALVKLIAEGDCNANVSWRLGYDGILVITGNGHIPDYAFDETPWGAYVESITSIVVEDGIDVIGKNCFIGCTEVTSVTLAQSVRLIDNGAFYGCSSLEEITLPDRLRRIGESAFFACSSLKSINVPDSVTAIGNGAFMKCYALESVKLSSKVSEIQRWTFAECHSLKSLDLSAVVIIGNSAFYNCKSLMTLTFSDMLGSVADYAFRSCPHIVASGIPATAVIGVGNTSIK